MKNFETSRYYEPLRPIEFSFNDASLAINDHDLITLYWNHTDGNSPDPADVASALKMSGSDSYYWFIHGHSEDLIAIGVLSEFFNAAAQIIEIHGP